MATPMSGAPSGWPPGSASRPMRPYPLFAISLVGFGAMLFVILGIWTLEAAVAAFGASSLGLSFACASTCASTQAVAMLSTGFLLLVTGWWMYRRPQFHVAEGLLVCVMPAVCEAVVGGFGTGLLVPTVVTAAGGVLAIVWTPIPRADRIRVAKQQPSP